MDGKEFVRGEIAKCIDKLAATSPADEAYSRILGGLHNVVALTECITDAIAFVEGREKATDAQEAKVIEFPKAETPFEEPEVFTPETVEKAAPTEEELQEIAEINSEEITEPEVKKTYTQAEVRQALVDARMQHGFDSSAYLRSFGVTSLTALPASRYAELMAGLAEKVK